VRSGSVSTACPAGNRGWRRGSAFCLVRITRETHPDSANIASCGGQGFSRAKRLCPPAATDCCIRMARMNPNRAVRPRALLAHTQETLLLWVRHRGSSAHGAIRIHSRHSDTAVRDPASAILPRKIPDARPGEGRQRVASTRTTSAPRNRSGECRCA
jgi:hypothetical protein